MTAKIKKSVLESNAAFDLLVAEHAGALRHWRDHHAALQKQQADIAAGKVIAPVDRFQPFNRPRASDQIEAAINENFEVDYEVIDDSADMLESRKRELIARILKLEGEALASIIPPGKQRFMILRETKIQESDAARGAALAQGSKPGFFKRMFGEGEVDIQTAIVESRPAEDAKFLGEMQEARRRAREIEFMAAEAMSDVEDLTTETIGQWKEPDFSGV